MKKTISRLSLIGLVLVTMSGVTARTQSSEDEALTGIKTYRAWSRINAGLQVILDASAFG